jgi:hypothetical protein
MDTFCQVFQLNQYASQEMKDYRASILDSLQQQADEEDFTAPKKGKKK